METTKQSSTAWNFGKIDTSLIKNTCLHEIFEQAVDKFPDNKAIDFDGVTITYSQLEASANSFAHYLRSLGVAADSSVALCLPKSIELYVAMLGILKAGAAYIPLDPSYPADRIAYVLENSEVKILITNTEVNKKLNHSGIVINVDNDLTKIATFPSKRLTCQETGVTTDNLAYVIYTSGSTGKPKGVMIEHKGICHLIRASQEIYGITSQDKVYQGISVAFDFSLEEIWMAFANGATLFPATQEMANAGNELSKLLTEIGITAISCVPTLLTMLDEDIPTLRFINVGGEDCPQSLIEKWSKPGRIFFNTYGPTETSVNATYAICSPDKKVTIGRPLPNFSSYILDENMQQVPFGEEGELYIGGIGLARGYVAKPDLTEERFVKNPFLETDPTGSPRLYKSGDLVKFDEEGNILFLGRIDTQVKIRGFRIELSEIENVISSLNNIKTAIVSVWEKAPDLKSIVAYVLPENPNIDVDLKQIRQVLKDSLPHYMVPQYLEIIDKVPQTPNGKIDRKSLPIPTAENQIEESENLVLPETKTEKIIASTWEEIFAKKNISITDHFFYDLGGHSLFAAKVVSKLRYTFPDLSMSDVYANPTIKELASFAQNLEKAPADDKQAKPKRKLLPKASFSFFAASQAAGIYLLYFLVALPFIVFYSFSKMRHHVISISQHNLWIYLALVIFAYFPAMILISLAAKWLLIGKYKQGEYPLWSSYYFRFWLVRRIQGLVPLQYLSGTPFMAMYLRLMGARVGNNVYIGTYIFQAHDLISIGDNSSIGVDTQLLGFNVEDGLLKIGSVEIAQNCYIGNHSVICPATTMEENSRLGSQALLPSGSVIKANENWNGSPAKKEPEIDSNLDAIEKLYSKYKNQEFNFGLAFSQAILILLLPIISTLAYIPVGYAMLMMYFKIGFWAIAWAPILAPIYIVTLSTEIALLKKLFLPAVKEGVYEINSIFYVRKWFVDQLMSLSLLSMNTLFATLYTPFFLRKLGVKVGKRVEVSTVSNISPNLLQLNDESFLADAACLGASKMHLGYFTLAPTVIGKRTFIGNAALVSSGNTLGDNCLIGVLSTAPKQGLCKNGTSWLGLPPMYLPNRDINKDFSLSQTYEPDRKLYAKRYSIEFFRVTLPTAINTAAMFLGYFTFVNIYHKVSHPEMILLLPLIVLLSQLLGALVVITLKWLVVGKYIPRIRPLWSTFVWRSEFITGIYEDAISAPLLHNLLGSPFAPAVLRMLGVNIGKQVYLDTTYVTEFDLVHVGDGAAINFNCSLQTHLFEDRVMKMSHVNVGKNCTVGNRAVVLYDTKMEEGSVLNSLSLLMKGESLPCNTYWQGAPAKHYVNDANFAAQKSSQASMQDLFTNPQEQFQTT